MSRKNSQTEVLQLNVDENYKVNITNSAYSPADVK